MDLYEDPQMLHKMNIIEYTHSRERRLALLSLIGASSQHLTFFLPILVDVIAIRIYQTLNMIAVS